MIRLGAVGRRWRRRGSRRWNHHLFSGGVSEENNTTFLHIEQQPPVRCPFSEASQAVAELDLAYLLAAVDRLVWPNGNIIRIQSNIAADILFYDVVDKGEEEGATADRALRNSYSWDMVDDALAADTDGAVGEEGAKPSPMLWPDTRFQAFNRRPSTHTRSEAFDRSRKAIGMIAFALAREGLS